LQELLQSWPISTTFAANKPETRNELCTSQYQNVSLNYVCISTLPCKTRKQCFFTRALYFWINALNYCFGFCLTSLFFQQLLQARPELPYWGLTKEEPFEIAGARFYTG